MLAERCYISPHKSLKCMNLCDDIYPATSAAYHTENRPFSCSSTASALCICPSMVKPRLSDVQFAQESEWLKCVHLGIVSANGINSYVPALRWHAHVSVK